MTNTEINTTELLDAVVTTADEVAQICEAAAQQTFDASLRSELESAARDQRGLVETLSSELESRGAKPRARVATKIASATSAMLASATCEQLGDASIAKTVLPMERKLEQQCKEACDNLATRRQLRQILAWAAEKAALRIEMLERRALPN